MQTISQQGNGNSSGGYSSSQSPGGYSSSGTPHAGGYGSSGGTGTCNQRVVYATQTSSSFFQPVVVQPVYRVVPAYPAYRRTYVEYDPVCCNLL